MIKSNQEPIYSMHCDGCGREYEDPYEGWTSFLDKDTILDRMPNVGWHLGDGEQGQDGFCYCPKCHRIDDEDIFHVVDVDPIYKMTNNYPGNKDFIQGELIKFVKSEQGVKYQIEIKDCQGDRIYTPQFFDKYPWLFIKIQ